VKRTGVVIALAAALAVAGVAYAQNGSSTDPTRGYGPGWCLFGTGRAAAGRATQMPARGTAMMYGGTYGCSHW